MVGESLLVPVVCSWGSDALSEEGLDAGEGMGSAMRVGSYL